MKNIIILSIMLSFMSSCGFSSYYGSGNTSDIESVESNVRTQINLTKIEFLPTDNADRIMKDELLMRMERFDSNSTKDYRYIMLIVTDYNVSSNAYNPSGAMLGMQVAFNAQYIIVDTGRINIDINDQILGVSMERLPSNHLIEKPNIYQNTNYMSLVGNPKKQNEARVEKFERQAQELRDKFVIVKEGSISNINEYLTSVVLLYDDYINRENTLEIVAKITAQDLMYQMIGIYSQYLKSNYNTFIEPANDGLNSVDILVDRSRKKIAPVVVKYFSIASLRDKILDLFGNKKEIEKEKPEYILQ